MQTPETTDIDNKQSLLSLYGLPDGTVGCIRKVEAPDEEANRLKAMGLCTGRNVVVVRNGDPMLLKVFGSRLGVSASLARMIWIKPKTPESCRMLQENPQ